MLTQKTPFHYLMTRPIAFLITLLLVGGFLNIIPTINTQAAPADHVLINEVQYDPSGNENEGEWIELFNPTNTTIDIGGYTLKEGASPSYTFPSPTYIGARNYLLTGNDDAEFVTAFPGESLDIDFPGAELFGLNNGGDELTLWDGAVGASNIVDFVGWESVTDWTTLEAGNGESICRINDEDNDVVADWQTCITPNPTSNIISGPGDITQDIQTWLKADAQAQVDGSNNITNWYDSSSSGNNYTTVFSDPQVTSNSFNYNPTVNFDGDDGLEGGQLEGDYIQVYSVISNANTSGNSTVFSTKEVITSDIFDVFTSDGASSVYTDDSILGGTFLGTFDSFDQPQRIVTTVRDNTKANTAATQIFENGESAAVGPTSGFGNQDDGSLVGVTYEVGLGNKEYFEGDIAELIVFGGGSSLHTSDQKKQIESYLALKYGVSLEQSVGDYLDSNAASVFDLTDSYHNNVLGIGKDSASSLDQRISKSANTGSILTISTDTDFVSSNTTHADSLTEGQYVVAGSDSGTTATQTTEVVGFGLRIGQEWKVTETGGVGHVNYKFDGFDDNWSVIIDDDGNFSSGASTVGALNTDGEIAIDVDGTEYITLATDGYTIEGEVYHDEDGEGDKDAGETTRLEGVAISLFDDNTGANSGNGILDGDETQIGSSVDSASDGTYSFSGLGNGDYLVDVDITDSSLNRDPANGADSTFGLTTSETILVSVPGGGLTGNDFGFDNAILELTSALPASVSEEGGVATWILTQSIPTGFTTDIGRELAGSTATFLQDFVLNGDIRIFPGETTSSFTSTGISDDLVEGDETILTTLGLNFGGSNAELGTTISQTVTLLDDDLPGFSVSESNLNIDEDGGSDDFEVVLDAQPISDVVIDVVVDDTNEAQVDQSSLTFTNSNWDDPQLITVTAQDDDIDRDDTAQVTISINDAGSDDAWDSLADQQVDINLVDDDTAAVFVSEIPTGNELNEGGSDLTLNVVLGSEPTSDVIINLSSGDTGAVSVSPATMTFDSSNWDQAQDYTLSPVDDDDTNDENVQVTFAVDDGLSDDTYDGITQNIDVDVIDDDELDLIITPIDDYEIDEGDTDVQAYGVYLTASPNIFTQVEITSSDPAVTINPLSESISFSTGFFTPKPVLISAPEDANGIDEVVTLTFQYDAGTPANQTQTRTVRVTDNDIVIDETVTSVIQNPISNEEVEVTVASSCGDLSTLASNIESELGDDPDYEYPLGLISYELPCASSQVEITWFGIDTNLNYAVRKYGPTTPGGDQDIFYDFDTVLEQVEVDGKIGLKATFTLTDGGFGDDTGVDGMIVDPIGLAVLESSNDGEMALIRTGGASTQTSLLIPGLVIVVLALFRINLSKNLID